MRVRTPLYLMLFSLAALTQAFVPAHASALANQTGGGECVPGGIYYYNTETGELCSPAGGDGGYGEPGSGWDDGTEPPDDGGSGTKPGETIVIHDPAPYYCGSVSDVYVEGGPENCPPIRTCSSMNGCVVCFPSDCSPISPPYRPAPRPKQQAKKPPKTSKPVVCQRFKDDVQRIYREYPDIFEFMLDNGFTAEEIRTGAVGINVVHESDSPAKPITAIKIFNSVSGMSRTVSVGEPREVAFAERVQTFVSKLSIVAQQQIRNHCDNDLGPIHR